MTHYFTFIKGDSPLVMTAIHDGNAVRAELEGLFSLDEQGRLREEDPFTGTWANKWDNRIIVHHSRFEVDINRPRKKAVYQVPDDAWGLEVWRKPLSTDDLQRSFQVYDDFYSAAKKYFDELFSTHEKIIVFDIHSYNHQREGVKADPAANPDVNLGTANMNPEVWQPIVDSLMTSFRTFDYGGRSLDVRENIKFKGGYFGKWLYEQYGDDICPISIEFKKIFMDELTGKGFENDIRLISEMVHSSTYQVLEALKKHFR